VQQVAGHALPFLFFLVVPGCKKSETANTAAAGASTTSTGTAARIGSKRAGDTIPTKDGDLRITPIRHGTLLLEHGGRAFYFDPVHDGNYEGLPKAHSIFVTDIHGDHFDPKGIEAVRQPLTTLVVPEVVANKLPRDTPHVVVMKNGETKTVTTDADDSFGLKVEALPMYNLVRGPSQGSLYHDKGRGNGYVLTIVDKRVYVAGDTECTPEMKALTNIDVAFVCMNLPYTMTPGEAAECVNAFKPKIVYPYHYRESKLEEFTGRIGANVEVRLREWYPQ
jgi:L-ascorbate metabolism protein UlaG (beta-lactamase superfamily)